MRGTTRLAYATVVISVALLTLGCAREEGGTSSPKAMLTPSPTRDAPSLSPSPVARPLLDTGSEGVLDPGVYVLDEFPVDIAFDIPDGDPPGWHVGRSDADHAIVLWFTPPEITYGFTFWNVDTVHAFPCDSPIGGLKPPIGPTVDDFVAALLNLPGFQATAPVDVTVGDLHGKEVELTALRSGGDCQSMALGEAGDELDRSPGQAVRVQVVGADGIRIVMHTIEPAERDAAVEAELDVILDSIRVEPLS